MHPYHGHFHHMGHWHRGPSRLVWFVLGAITAAWWIKRKDSDRRIFGHCMRPPVQALPPADGSLPSPANPTVTYTWPQNVAEIPRAINNIPPAHSSPVSSSPGALGEWEQEKEHLAKISRQATDAMTDLTESTLESVLATAQSLKAKLAEHRAQRDKQQKLIEQQIEEQRRDPPRLV